MVLEYWYWESGVEKRVLAECYGKYERGKVAKGKIQEGGILNGRK